MLNSSFLFPFGYLLRVGLLFLTCNLELILHIEESYRNSTESFHLPLAQSHLMLSMGMILFTKDLI